MSRMMRTPCILLRRKVEGEDKYGNPTSSVVEVGTVCSLQEQRRDERSDISNTLWDLYLPIEAEIDSGDAVIVRGLEYEVVGEPWRAEEGSPALWHIEATVTRTAGTDEEDA